MTIASFSMLPNTRVVFGAGRSDKLGEDVKALAGEGAAVLLVADPGIPKIADVIEATLKMAGCKVALYTDVRSDPLGVQVDGAATAARSLGAKIVIGLGGGSTLDVAKFAAAIAPADQPADHYELSKNRLPAKGLKKSACRPPPAPDRRPPGSPSSPTPRTRRSGPGATNCAPIWRCWTPS